VVPVFFAELFPVFGAHWKNQRLMRAAQGGGPGDGAKERHVQVHRGFHHGGGWTAFDRSEQDEHLVLRHKLPGIGLGFGGLVVIVQRLEHDLPSVDATAGVDGLQVGLDTVLHRHAVVVFSALQRDVLANQDLAW
jgi:hypothetical protein